MSSYGRRKAATLQEPAWFPDGGQVEWRDLLQDVREDDQVANWTYPDQLAGEATACDCFRHALNAIRFLDETLDNIESIKIDRALRVVQDAVQTSKRFCDCTSMCRRDNVLLHVTIFRLLDTVYSAIDSLLLAAPKNEANQSMEISLATFRSRVSFHPAIGRAVLGCEIMGAAECASFLTKTVKGDALDSSDPELQCVEDMLLSAAAGLIQKANDLLICDTPSASLTAADLNCTFPMVDDFTFTTSEAS